MEHLEILISFASTLQDEELTVHSIPNKRKIEYNDLNERRI